MALLDGTIETSQEFYASPVDEDSYRTLEVAIVIQNALPKGRVFGCELLQHTPHRVASLHIDFYFLCPHEWSQRSEDLHPHRLLPHFALDFHMPLRRQEAPILYDDTTIEPKMQEKRRHCLETETGV